MPVIPVQTPAIPAEGILWEMVRPRNVPHRRTGDSERERTVVRGGQHRALAASGSEGGGWYL
eukprot:gene6885-6151_t